MVFFVSGVAALGILIVLGRAFIGANPSSLVRAIRYTLGIVLIGVGAVLALGERFGLVEHDEVVAAIDAFEVCGWHAGIGAAEDVVGRFDRLAHGCVPGIKHGDGGRDGGEAGAGVGVEAGSDTVLMS
jgi:hypothetical protein